jgi:hypothetical protein
LIEAVAVAYAPPATESVEPPVEEPTSEPSAAVTLNDTQMDAADVAAFKTVACGSGILGENPNKTVICGCKAL